MTTYHYLKKHQLPLLIIFIGLALLTALATAIKLRQEPTTSAKSEPQTTGSQACTDTIHITHLTPTPQPPQPTTIPTSAEWSDSYITSRSLFDPVYNQPLWEETNDVYLGGEKDYEAEEVMDENDDGLAIKLNGSWVINTPAAPVTLIRGQNYDLRVGVKNNKDNPNNGVDFACWVDWANGSPVSQVISANDYDLPLDGTIKYYVFDYVLSIPQTANSQIYLRCNSKYYDHSLPHDSFHPTDYNSHTASGEVEDYLIYTNPPPAAPSISIVQAGQPIGNGSLYNFGNLNPDSSKSLIFTITNNANNANLIFTGSPYIQIHGTNAGGHPEDYQVTKQPYSPILPGGSTTFEITFTPGGLGTRVAQVYIPNNTSGATGNFDFTIQGFGQKPEIVLKQGATSIPGFGSFNFGSARLYTSREFSFTIANIGNSSLNLTGAPLVEVSGSSKFVVTQQPTTPISANGGTTTFKIRFRPTSPVTVSAQVRIENNDNDENPYFFTVRGRGYSDPGPM